MQPMWCYAGNPVDLDDTNWRITPVDTNAKDSLNPEALQCGCGGGAASAHRGVVWGDNGWQRAGPATN